MSEQPPSASGHLPRPGEPSPHGLEPDPEAPPAGAFTGRPSHAGDGVPTAGAGTRAAPDAEERLRGSAGDRLDRAADAARRLGHRAREQGGIAGRAEPLAYRVGDSLQDAARYLRGNDVRDMRQDLEGGVRASPIRSLAVAAVAGFLVGRMLR